jgi:hypothetical protein
MDVGPLPFSITALDPWTYVDSSGQPGTAAAALTDLHLAADPVLIPNAQFSRFDAWTAEVEADLLDEVHHITLHGFLRPDQPTGISARYVLGSPVSANFEQSYPVPIWDWAFDARFELIFTPPPSPSVSGWLYWRLESFRVTKPAESLLAPFPPQGWTPVFSDPLAAQYLTPAAAADHMAAMTAAYLAFTAKDLLIASETPIEEFFATYARKINPVAANFTNAPPLVPAEDDVLIAAVDTIESDQSWQGADCDPNSADGFSTQLGLSVVLLGWLPPDLPPALPAGLPIGGFASASQGAQEIAAAMGLGQFLADPAVPLAPAQAVSWLDAEDAEFPVEEVPWRRGVASLEALELYFADLLTGVLEVQYDRDGLSFDCAGLSSSIQDFCAQLPLSATPSGICASTSSQCAVALAPYFLDADPLWAAVPGGQPPEVALCPVITALDVADVLASPSGPGDPLCAGTADPAWMDSPDTGSLVLDLSECARVDVTVDFELHLVFADDPFSSAPPDCPEVPPETARVDLAPWPWSSTLESSVWYGAAAAPFLDLIVDGQASLGVALSWRWLVPFTQHGIPDGSGEAMVGWDGFLDWHGAMQAPDADGLSGSFLDVAQTLLDVVGMDVPGMATSTTFAVTPAPAPALLSAVLSGAALAPPSGWPAPAPPQFTGLGPIPWPNPIPPIALPEEAFESIEEQLSDLSGSIAGNLGGLSNLELLVPNWSFEEIVMRRGMVPPTRGYGGRAPGGQEWTTGFAGLDPDLAQVLALGGTGGGPGNSAFTVPMQLYMAYWEMDPIELGPEVDPLAEDLDLLIDERYACVGDWEEGPPEEIQPVLCWADPTLNGEPGYATRNLPAGLYQSFFQAIGFPTWGWPTRDAVERLWFQNACDALTERPAQGPCAARALVSLVAEEPAGGPGAVGAWLIEPYASSGTWAPGRLGP